MAPASEAITTSPSANPASMTSRPAMVARDRVALHADDPRDCPQQHATERGEGHPVTL